jgi:hypothetical protein
VTGLQQLLLVVGMLLYVACVLGAGYLAGVNRRNRSVIVAHVAPYRYRAGYERAPRRWRWRR